DGRLGIGVVGALPAALALARSLVLQAVWSLSPAQHRLSVFAPGTEAAWLGELPHRIEEIPGGTDFAACLGEAGAEPLLTVAVAATAEQLAAPCKVVVSLGAEGVAEVIRHPELSARGQLRPAFLSRAQAQSWASRLHADAVAAGLTGAERSL